MLELKYCLTDRTTLYHYIYTVRTTLYHYIYTVRTTLYHYIYTVGLWVTLLIFFWKPFHKKKVMS